MALTIRLRSPELKRRLKLMADLEGKSDNQYVVDLIKQDLDAKQARLDEYERLRCDGQRPEQNDS